ncbi:MAG: hypothetical protein HQM03_07880 [Magnetococcales bacterium]|nr:hypothetical protein [Magnetococcales bacterium]
MGIPALFTARGGLDIGIHIIPGNGAPNGGRADEAVIGSFHADQSNGHLYIKKASGAGLEKWTRLQNQQDLAAALLGLSWREPVLCLDNTAYADVAAAETAANTGMVNGVAVGDGSRILFTGIAGANKNVFLISGTPGSGATLVEDGNDASKGDTVQVQDGTWAGHKFNFNGAIWVSTGAEDWTEVGFIRTFLGKSGVGNEMPSYASVNIVDNGESLESGIGALDAAIGPQVTSTRHIAASATITANLSTLDRVLADAKSEKKVDNVTALTVLDTVAVDQVLSAEWTIHSRSVATPSQVNVIKVMALHNGTSAADATGVNHNWFAEMRLGGEIATLHFEVGLSGSGGAQVMQLKGSCNSAVHVRLTRSVLNEQ